MKWHATTILCVRRKDKVAIGGDGQVTLGTTIVKHDTRKIRWVLDNKVLVGFAGSTADAARECHVANNVRLRRSASSSSALTSDNVAPGGFSSMT